MKNVSQEYKENLILKKLNTLTEMYYNPRVNKKKVLQSLIDVTNEYKEKINEAQTEDRLNYYKYLEKNNKSLNFSVDRLFPLLEKNLTAQTDTRFRTQTVIEEKNAEIIKTDILTNIPKISENSNLTDYNIYNSLISGLGEYEILVRVSNVEKSKFLDVSKLIKPTRVLNSESDIPIYYYGGKNTQQVNSTIDEVIKCANKYGVSFSKYNYQKSLLNK